MIPPILSDIVLDGVGSVCMMFVLLLILDGLLQERKLRRDRQARASLVNSRQPRSSVNKMAGGRLKFSRRPLVVLFVLSVVFAVLFKEHGVSKSSTAANAVMPPANQLSSNGVPGKAVAELADTKSIVPQAQSPTLGATEKTMATNVISVDLYNTGTPAEISGKLSWQ